MENKDRDEARKALLAIYNQVEELQVSSLIVAFVTDKGIVGFGGSNLNSIAMSGMGDYIKTVARSTWGKTDQFDPFPQMPVSGAKPM